MIITLHYFVYLSITIICGQTGKLLTYSTMMWRTLLPFWASALVPSVCLLTMIQKLYFCERTNKELINLLYNDVKNLTSILSFCIGPKCVSNEDIKALFLCELHFSLIFKSRPFWASALVPSVCLLTMIQKLYFCVNYTFHLFLQVNL